MYRNLYIGAFGATPHLLRDRGRLAFSYVNNYTSAQGRNGDGQEYAHNTKQSSAQKYSEDNPKRLDFKRAGKKLGLYKVSVKLLQDNHGN